jgi:hypothetical protein
MRESPVVDTRIGQALADLGPEAATDPGLHRLLSTALDGLEAAACVDHPEQLGTRVHRLRAVLHGQARGLVVKHLPLRAAQRTELVARRWLPALQLTASGPPLLGAAVDAGGRGVWHVYEDLGDAALDTDEPDPEQVRAVIQVVAQVHVRFADHPLLAECRLHGGDLGMHFYACSVRDAVRALEAVHLPTVEVLPEQAEVRDRLLQHLHLLLTEQPGRAQALAELGGPDTLLHGDLWPINTLVVATLDGPRARLIDWDRAGVGPIAYDLSAFLRRFPARHRAWILDAYRDAAGRLGWCLPVDRDLNLLFETAERARFANCAIWPALALVQDGAAWGFEALAEVAGWFDKLEPVLSAGRDQT